MLAGLQRRGVLSLGAASAASLVLPGTFDSADAAVGPRAGGALSGLSWNSGAFNNVEALAAFRRRPLDVYGSFVKHGSWEQMLGFPYNTNFPAYAKKPVWISLGYPLIPKNIGGISSAKWTQLAATGNSVSNDFYAKHERIARSLGAVMRSARCRGVIARVGWEFNGSQAWKLSDYSKAAQYCSVFRRIVAILRKNVPGIVIEWNPLRKGTQGKLPISQIYPGNDVVDIVSICHYDRLPSFNSKAIWDAQYNQLSAGGNPWGIGAWLSFAKRNGKKLAVPEWGLANGMKHASGSKDNPLFMEMMYDFFKRNAGDIAYETYFNNIHYHQIVPSIRNPKGAAAYRSLYAR